MASSKPKRYFINEAKDFTGADLAIPSGPLQQKILHHIQDIVTNLTPAHTGDGGMYIGGIGVAFMFYRVAKCELFHKQTKQYLTRCLQYLKPVLTSSPTPADDPTSLILGDAGMFVVASAVYRLLGDEEKAIKYMHLYANLHCKYLPADFMKCGGDEMFVGRSGFLAGAFWLANELKSDVMKKAALHSIGKAIVKSGRDYSTLHRSPCPLMFSYYGTEYVGAAHGLSFILQMLLSMPDFVDSDPSIKNDIKDCVDYVVSLQTESGNFPCALDEVGEHARSESDELVHWCHGAPGVIPLLAKAYTFYKDEKYLKSALKGGELVWRKGLLKKGPGLCHGIAGNGYVFLTLYRLTDDKKHLHRALEFASFMDSKEFEKGARIPDSPHSLFEGVAGTVCFLLDLLNPKEAAFPFHNAFV